MSENKTPAISVIVPVYNVEKYLERCLDTLANQTIDSIEILVINDGSPDNSQEIIDRYCEEYPDRFKSYIKENGGLSDARNYGLERATGKYIAFVDSDDHVEYDFYKSMVERAEETGAEVVCCPIAYELKRKRIWKSYYEEGDFGHTVRENPKMLYRANSVVWNKIYNRDFWERNGFRFEKQWFEDSQLIYNVLLVANKVEAVNVPFYYYNKANAKSITASVDSRIYDIFKSTDSIINFYKAHGAFDDLYEEIEYLVVRHLFGRIPALKKSKDKSEVKPFVDRMYAYLNEYFPKWRRCKFFRTAPNAKKSTQLRLKIYKHKPLLLFYASDVVKLKKIRKKIDKRAKKFNRFKGRMRKRLHGEQLLNDELVKQMKRDNIQDHGMEVLYSTQQVLKNLGIVSFADFGTLLGLIREGKLLAHDLDIDTGAIADIEQQKMVRRALEDRGYKLWRQYCVGDYVAEESYKIDGIKIDINYYQMTPEAATTWLFYWQRGFKYKKKNHRHIVRMTYSPFTEVKTETFQGYDIDIPINPEKLLEEKYGPTWRVPDTGWIYWESPAATKLDEMGYFRTFTYAREGSYHQHHRYKEAVDIKRIED